MEGFRSVLEVCKWLSAHDVLTMSQVSGEWKKVTNSSELWWELNNVEGFHTTQGVHPKLEHRRLNNLRNTLVVIKPNGVRGYNCKLRKWGLTHKTSENIQVDAYSSSAILPDGTLLCCGGHMAKPWKTVYHLTLTGTVQTYSDMMIPRGGHGLIVSSGTIYAFGGCGGNSAESMTLDPFESLSTRHWEQLPCMISTRCYFTPCASGTLIYLIGGFTDKSEVFDCVKVTYTALLFVLPESSEVCVALNCSEIVVLTPSFTGRLNLLNPDSLVTMKHMKWASVWGSMNAIFTADSVFNPFDGQIQHFNLMTHKKHVFTR